MERLTNRKEAGQLLAQKLGHYANRKDVTVLGLPRGGIPVAYEISQKLKVPLDALLVRKLGVPWHEELAMGALAQGNIIVFNDEIIRSLGIPQAEIEAVIQAEKKEMQRRNKKYRNNRPLPNLKDKITILVDDGLATGSTMRAAIQAVSHMKPQKMIVAVPVAPRDTVEQFKKLTDELVCLIVPEDFWSISQWYEEFPQTTDEEVIALLNKQSG